MTVETEEQRHEVLSRLERQDTLMKKRNSDSRATFIIQSISVLTGTFLKYEFIKEQK